MVDCFELAFSIIISILRVTRYSSPGPSCESSVGAAGAATAATLLIPCDTVAIVYSKLCPEVGLYVTLTALERGLENSNPKYVGPSVVKSVVNLEKEAC